jgi:predicted AAA+ superfamily ATPase
VITGSSNYLLLAKTTESLAGRVGLTTLLPLSLAELGDQANTDTDTLLFNGGYPAIWGQGFPQRVVADVYYRTYIERDLRQIVNLKDLSAFQTFIRLCAGRVGTEFNANTLAGEVGVDFKTIKEWLSLLEASYVVFRLPPFFQNIGKRLVKSPKIYFYDTALVCYLLGIESPEQLRTHPLRGAIFENLVVLEFMKNRLNAGRPSNLFFYRDQSQHEVDIVQEFGWQYRAYEVKSATAYHSDFTKNLSYLKKILGDRLISGQVIYDGKMEQDIPENGHINFRRVGKLSPYPPAEGSALKIC